VSWKIDPRESSVDVTYRNIVLSSRIQTEDKVSRIQGVDEESRI
jgi:hypothetical protein